ncbi:MAG: hypothetical protein SVU32_09030 [Candidatus Nanohaloarchaea archaeon]|nr:hypothetical protein [Candidatus Nanohaloarchaea archaeon]
MSSGRSRAPLTFLPEDAPFRYESDEPGRELADRTLDTGSDEPDRAVRVGQGGYAVAEDVVLATDNLFSCVGVVAYDAERQRGLVSHVDYRSVQERDPVEELYEAFGRGSLEVALVLGPEPMDAILEPIEERLQDAPEGIEVDDVETVYAGLEGSAGGVALEVDGSLSRYRRD